FSSRRRHTRSTRDWSSDVCSSDLFERAAILVVDGASEAHTAMLAAGEGNAIRVLKRIALPHSLGQYYAAITAYLGFRPDQDEYRSEERRVGKESRNRVLTFGYVNG